MTNLMPYQKNALKKFFEAKPFLNGVILEIGSDVNGFVLKELLKNSTGKVIGINPDPNFNYSSIGIKKCFNFECSNESGSNLSLDNSSVDAVFSVATLEHINEIDKFYDEIFRVLKPGGIFFADFAPIWSSHVGHHSFVVNSNKEVRYWKPGRNPIPDFSHLILSKNEMRALLKNGPIDDSLIEPLLDFIYDSDGINRYTYLEHLKFIEQSKFLKLYINKIFSVEPSPEQLLILNEKFGYRNRFDIFGLQVLLVKPKQFFLYNLFYLFIYYFNSLKFSFIFLLKHQYLLLKRISFIKKTVSFLRG